MGDEDPIIGRENELKTLEAALASGRPGLILIVGYPGTGKRRLLAELRARAAAYPCRLVPPDPVAEGETPWLVVGKNVTVDDFRRSIAPPSEAEVKPEHSQPEFDLILVYGYVPEEDFHEWFTEEFLRGLVAATPPKVVAVAGNASDVAGLEPLANRRVVLGPLRREAVVAELRAIDSTIADRLQQRELEMYADAIVADPSLLGALRHVLPLTPAAHASETTLGEG